MKARRYYSAFTPSQHDKEVLEQLFVVRESMVEKIVAGIVESVTSNNKHYYMLVGPRGIGKTHLVSLINYRVQDSPQVKDKLCIAWLTEDAYDASYNALLKQIIDCLKTPENVQQLEVDIDRLLDINNQDEQQQFAEKLILDTIGERTLLIIAENMDVLLSNIGEQGQHNLRAFIQNHSRFCLLTTATSLSAAASERKSALYGFFDIRYLEAFSTQDAIKMLTKLALAANDQALADNLNSPLGQARIQAVHFLAGGNPRIYTVFFDFLSCSTLDDLTTPFMAMIDDMTPYYQAHMSGLAPLQRNIIYALVKLEHAVTVKEIARQVMRNQTSISKQLGLLEKLGYVQKTMTQGRSSYYEIREPLMRLCLQVKDQRGGSIRLFVEFLRIWYSTSELNYLLSQSNQQQTSLYYLALNEAIDRDDPLSAQFEKQSLGFNDPTSAKDALEKLDAALLREPENTNYLKRKAWCLNTLNNNLSIQADLWKKITKLEPDEANNWNWLGMISAYNEDFMRSEKAYLKAFELAPNVAQYHLNYAHTLSIEGQYLKAKEALDKGLKLRGKPKTAKDWVDRANALYWTNQYEGAIEAYMQGILTDYKHLPCWDYLGGILQTCGLYSKPLGIYKKMVDLLDTEPQALRHLAVSFFWMGEIHSAIETYEKSLELFEASKQHIEFDKTVLYFAESLYGIQEYQRASELIEPIVSNTTQPCLLNRRPEQLKALTISKQNFSKGIELIEQNLRDFQDSKFNVRDITYVRLLLMSGRIHTDWNPYAQAYLDIFNKLDMLPVLGKLLVRSLRFYRLPQINNDVAQKWLQLWQTIGANKDELKIPLQLMTAATEFKCSKDKRALLTLPKEQRALLEPWFLNLMDEESETRERITVKIRDFLSQLDHKVEQQRKKEYWRLPVSKLNTKPQAILNYADAESANISGLRPLFAGDWKPIRESESNRLLTQVIAQNDIAKRIFSRENLTIVSAFRQSLSFSTFDLIQLNIVENGKIGAVDLLFNEQDTVILDGSSSTIYQLFGSKHIQLETSQQQSDYCRFFVSAMRADHGRFEIPEDTSELTGMVSDKGNQILNDKLISWNSKEKDKHGDVIYQSSIIYGQALSQVDFKIADIKTGFVKMIDDVAIATEVEIDIEHFDGPLRFYA